MKKLNLIFLSSLLLILILRTTSFASGTWDLSEYREIYDIIASKADSTFTFYSLDSLSTDSLFDVVTDALNSSNYEQSNYANALCYVDFANSAITFNFINSTTTNPLDKTKPRGTMYIKVPLSNGVLGTPTNGVVSNDSAYFVGSYFYNSNYPRLWNITNQNTNYISPTQTQFYAYRGVDLDILGENSFEKLYIGTENNYVINRDFVIGNSYQIQNYDFYYFNENGDKISLKENINYNFYTYWWGNIYSFYILQENISLFPKYTDFYVSLEVTAKANYNTTFEIEKKAFRTSNTGSNIGGEPGEGEDGGDTGEGTTTPDYSEDLDNIQTGITNINNNLNNIQESIPTSGEIAGATTQGNKDYWGNSDEMNEEDYENQISDGINDSMDEISEELEQNEVFNSIAVAEQKIIDLFLEEPEDFKISWQDVKYMEKTLVPAGEINFSQLCRENETLGRVKNILNIIVSAMISLALFKQIFNLIMVTLGIDHPLVLETEKDDITEISSTRIGNKTYVTKKTYKSDKKGAR